MGHHSFLTFEKHLPIGSVFWETHERSERLEYSHRTERSDWVVRKVWTVLANSICRRIAHVSVGTYDAKYLEYGRRVRMRLFEIRNKERGVDRIGNSTGGYSI